MPGNLLSKFGTSNQAFTLTVTSLANNAAQGSTAIDNSTNLYTDALVVVKVKTNAAGTSTTGYVNVYAYGTADGGTTYQEGFAGTNGSVTLTVPPNARLIGVINAVANATTYYLPPSSVAQAFGGVLPEKWGIIVENKTGAALDASIGNAFYQGVYGSYT